MTDQPITPGADVDLDALPTEQAIALLNRTLADPDVQGADDHDAEQTPAPQIGDLA